MPRKKVMAPIREPEEAWEIAKQNSGLVYSILFKFINNHDNIVWYKGNDLQAELESHAWEGMYNACLYWDESKGTLSTYAVPSIQNSMKKALDKLMKMGGNQKGGGQIPLKYKTTPPVFSLDALTEAWQDNSDYPANIEDSFANKIPQPWADLETEEEKILESFDKERMVKKIEELAEIMPEPHRSVFKIMALGPREEIAYGHYIRYATMGMRKAGKKLHFADRKVKKLYLESLEWMENQLKAANYGEEENDG